MCKTIRDTRRSFCAFYAHFPGCIRIYFELLFKFLSITISKTDKVFKDSGVKFSVVCETCKAFTSKKLNLLKICTY